MSHSNLQHHFAEPCQLLVTIMGLITVWHDTVVFISELF